MRLPLLFLVSTLAMMAEIGPSSFRHRFIAREMPGANVGFGTSALADFDRDGDLDFAVLNRGDRRLYWFEHVGKDEWKRHLACEAQMAQLGGLAMDVDGDGWTDVVSGRYWFRNPGKPREKAFERYSYDASIRSEIHDMAAADIDGDGRQDIVAMGDRQGCFWYSIPKDPARDGDWPRTKITDDVLDDRVDIHAGFFPAGVGDLDKDGDADVFLADRWMENTGGGRQWAARRVYFGRRGPWGFSTRSAIADIDGDGDNDIVVADCDGQNSAVAWLENDGKTPPAFTTRYLANRAPGTRGSFHAMRLADFDGDGDADILVVEQEDPKILPVGAGGPRWFIFENLGGGRFEERLIFDGKLGGHDSWVGDVDGDGDLDIVSKIWRVWAGNGNGGRVHVDWLENLRVSGR